MALGQITVWAGLLYVFPALLLHWERGFGWARSEITGAITVAILLSAFIAPVVGRWIDGGKGPQVMGFGTILGASALFSLSFVSALWQFYLCWSVIGLALACALYEPCFAIVTRCRGTQAKSAIISITVLAGFAGALSFPLAHALTEHYGWQNCVRIFAAVVLFVSAPALWKAASLLESAIEPDMTADGEGKLAAPLRLTRMPLFWLLAVSFSLLGVVHGVTLHHLLAILDHRSVAKELAVTIAAFIGPMQVTGRLIMTVFAPHVSNHGVAVFCYLSMGLAIAILAVAGTNPSLLVGFVIAFGCSYGISQFGVKSGALALVYLIGSACAPLLDH
nr:uncharacterized MFS-type transporter YbfB-like [Nerophis lumbriciformis]